MVFSHSFAGAITTNKYLKGAKNYTKKQLDVLYFVGITSSILPDLDTLVVVFNSYLKHRRFLSHSFVPYLVIFLIGILIAKLFKKPFLKDLFLVFGFGVLTHLTIDFFYGGLVALAPISNEMYGIKIKCVSTSRLGWLYHYLRSKFIVGELLLLIAFGWSMKNIKNKLGKALPIIFFIASIIILILVTI